MMKRTLLAALFLAIAAWCGVDRAVAQSTTPPASAAARLRLIAEEPQPQLTATQAPKTDSALPPPEPRPTVSPSSNDPTVPNAAMRELLGNARTDSQGPPPGIPDIRLRARVIVRGKPPAALIEIGGDAVRSQAQTQTQVGQPGERPRAHPSSGAYRTIREGEEFVVPQGDSTSPIRVVKLSATEVLLEIVNRKMLMRLD